MGSHKSKEVPYSRLTKYESAFVQNTFHLLSQDNGWLKSDDLLSAWSYLVDPEFLVHLKNACFRKSADGCIKIKPFAKHFYIVVNGNVSEKAYYIAAKIFNIKLTRPQGLLTSKLIHFVSSIVRSYFLILSKSQSKKFHSWVDNGVVIDNVDVNYYTQFAVKEIIHSTKITVRQIEHWLCQLPMLMKVWRDIVIHLYSHMNPISLPKFSDSVKLPSCLVPDSYGPIQSILTIAMVLFINDALPALLKRKWTPLFNSEIHGTNFEDFVEKISHKGPSVIIVKDECDYVFGGFAPTSWDISQQFQGDITAALFTLRPKMGRFISSGHNEHYQYLNTQQESLPNGLGMGGQYNYWGLWIDENFETGQSSATCSTFLDYTPMSSEKAFQVQHVEVWGVGEPKEKAELKIETRHDLRGVYKFGVDLGQSHTGMRNSI